MNDLKLYNDTVCSETLVSNLFIDRYMPSANGEYVKIFLHLLRCTQHHLSCSVSSIADLFDHTEKDVIRALRYWERQGLLSLDTDAEGELTAIHLIAAQETPDAGDIPSAAASVVPAIAVPAENTHSAITDDPSMAEASPAIADPVIRQYSADEVMAFNSNPEIPEMLFIIATYLNRPLTDTDTNTILFWYDELHFDRDLIEYLVEYCVTKDHSSIRYMNKVALNWHAEGITNETEARAHSEMQSKLYYAVMRSLGIYGRNLTPAENEFLQRWSKEYGFSNEMITAACERTILATSQPSFKYTESILANWKKQGLRSLSDVEKADAQFDRKEKAASGQKPQGNNNRRNTFTNFEQRSYDGDDLERRLLSTDV